MESIEPRRLLSGDGWFQVAKLVADDGASGAYFGLSVAVSDGLVLVGSPGDAEHGSRSGAAYLFDASTGQQVAKLAPTSPVAGEEFGYSVAISGDLAIVGTEPDYQAGAAYLFDVTTGQQLAKLRPSDLAAEDQFGVSVAVHGTRALAGSRFDDDLGDRSGSAYLFDTANGNRQTKLLPGDGAKWDDFGFSTALGADVALVGSPGHTTRSAETILVSAGAAYLFDAATGQQLTKLLAIDAAAHDGFGHAVTLDAAHVLVSSPNDDDLGDNSGSVYVFDAATRSHVRKLLADDGAAADRFGQSVAASGGLTLVGSPNDDDLGSNSGAAYLFDTATGQQLAKLTARDGAADDWFGHAVALDEDFAVVGAYRDDDDGSFSGAVYLFQRTEPPGVAADLVDGTLLITGTAGDDVVEIANDFEGNITVTSGEQAWSFPSADIFDIDVDLLASNDALTIRQTVFHTVNYAGGDGRDSVWAEASNGTDDAASLTAERFVGGGNLVYFADVEDITADLMYSDDAIIVRMGDAFAGTATVLGGEGRDNFSLISGRQGITLDGEEGDDTFEMPFPAYAHAVGGAGKDTARVTGTDGSDNAQIHSQQGGWDATLVEESGTRSGFMADLGTEVVTFDLGAGNDGVLVSFDTVHLNRLLDLNLLVGSGSDVLAWQPIPQSNYSVTTRLSLNQVATGMIGGTFDAELEHIRLTGTGLPDRFEVTPVAQEVIVAGHAPFPEFQQSGADTLALNLEGAVGLQIETGTPGAGTFRFDNRGDIIYFTTEAIEGLPGPTLIDGHFDFEEEQAVELSLAHAVPTSVSLADAVLTNLDSGHVVPDAFAGMSTSGGPGIPTSVRLERGVSAFGPLPDGNYRLSFPAGTLEDALGTPNGVISFDFFVFAGDTNRDRKVDFTDFLTLRGNFGRADAPLFSEADFNYDDKVDFADFLILRSQFGKSLPPPISSALFDGGEEDEEEDGGKGSGSVVAQSRLRQRDGARAHAMAGRSVPAAASERASSRPGRFEMR